MKIILFFNFFYTEKKMKIQHLNNKRNSIICRTQQKK